MRRIPFALLFVVFTPCSLFAQTIVPKVITGIASSARYCVSGNAANIHSLGWVAAQTGYTIEFEADFDLAAAIVRFEPSEHRSTIVDGNPGFNYNASTSGTMVLHVGGNGRPGCYRYRVLMDPPVASITAVEPGSRTREGHLPTSERQSVPFARPLAITGNPSGAQHCIAGNLVTNVHEIGRVDQQSRVTVSVDADFNAVVGATAFDLDPTADNGSFVVDPPSGGSRTPSLSFTAEPGENIVLYVAGFNGAAGCYKYQVEIR